LYRRQQERRRPGHRAASAKVPTATVRADDGEAEGGAAAAIGREANGPLARNPTRSRAAAKRRASSENIVPPKVGTATETVEAGAGEAVAAVVTTETGTAIAPRRALRNRCKMKRRLSILLTSSM
jgi:hypothetical protein